MVVLYLKMRAKGTCGVRTRDRSQSDAVPFAGSIYRRTFHGSLHWILKDLWFSKAVHLLSIPFTLVVPLPFIATGDQGLYAIGMSIPFFGYLFAGVLEVCGHDSFSKQVEGATEHFICSRTCGVVRSWFFGLVMWLGCVVLSSL